MEPNTTVFMPSVKKVNLDRNFKKLYIKITNNNIKNKPDKFQDWKNAWCVPSPPYQMDLQLKQSGTLRTQGRENNIKSWSQK